jgi:hypothetical protein
VEPSSPESPSIRSSRSTLVRSSADREFKLIRESFSRRSVRYRWLIGSDAESESCFHSAVSALVEPSNKHTNIKLDILIGMYGGPTGILYFGSDWMKDSHSFAEILYT